jgi:hypothetical protein
MKAELAAIELIEGTLEIAGGYSINGKQYVGDEHEAMVDEAKQMAFATGRDVKEILIQILYNLQGLVDAVRDEILPDGSLRTMDMSRILAALSKVPAVVLPIEKQKTEILHTGSESVHRLKQNGWVYLCDGHGDVRLTGGVWMYKGDKAEAQLMQQEAWKNLKKRSDSYYSQPYI